MATYIYNCRNKECDRFEVQFDKKHSMLAPALKKCKHCEKDTLERMPVLGAPPIIKGIGIYGNGTQ